MKEIREEKKKEKIENVPEAAEEPAEEVIEAVEESVEEVAEAAPVMEEKAVEHVEKAKKEDTKYSNNSKYFQPIKQRKDLEEDRETGARHLGTERAGLFSCLHEYKSRRDLHLSRYAGFRRLDPR